MKYVDAFLIPFIKTIAIGVALYLLIGAGVKQRWIPFDNKTTKQNVNQR